MIRAMFRLAFGGLFWFGALAALSVFLAACATIPCAPGTCDIGQQWEENRDPFPVGAISFGTIFGPQPDPGRVTVEPAAPK